LNGTLPRDFRHSPIELVQTWVVHHLMIIEEACRALIPVVQATHPSEEWALAAGLRNVIVHEYFGVDIDVVWGVVERDLPSLKGRIQEILGEAQEETPGEALP